VPKQALTVGVGTVMDANEVLVLITGASKAYALYKVKDNIYNNRIQSKNCSALKYAAYEEILRKCLFVIPQKLKYHMEVISFHVIPCDSVEYFTAQYRGILWYLRNSVMDANEVFMLITGASKAYALYKYKDNIQYRIQSKRFLALKFPCKCIKICILRGEFTQMPLCNSADVEISYGSKFISRNSM
jgi:hypothetical protein